MEGWIARNKHPHEWCLFCAMIVLNEIALKLNVFFNVFVVFFLQEYVMHVADTIW